MVTGNSSRRDDIESLFYASFKHSYFGLPWLCLFNEDDQLTDNQKSEKVFNMKDENEFLNQYIGFPI